MPKRRRKITRAMKVAAAAQAPLAPRGLDTPAERALNSRFGKFASHQYDARLAPDKSRQ